MTADQIAALGPAFAAFLAPFEACFVGSATVAHMRAYCRGLLSDLPRKSVEPIALAAGTAVRTLQEFLRDHVWDHADMLGRLRRTVAGLPAMRAADELGTVGSLDETTVAKKGTKTPGVQRMYCGAAGKVENCILTVHLAVSRGRFKTLVDADLYIPKSWDADRKRCRAAKIPDSAVHRTKSAMALEQVARPAPTGCVWTGWASTRPTAGRRPSWPNSTPRASASSARCRRRSAASRSVPPCASGTPATAAAPPASAPTAWPAAARPSIARGGRRCRFRGRRSPRRSGGPRRRGCTRRAGAGRRNARIG